ncbi:MAG: hypothetical protein CL936_11160 [Deltaproteobacteria bacterium]|nr:hypothetical protein [Deltaproteobacteria bacterium]
MLHNILLVVRMLADFGRGMKMQLQKTSSRIYCAFLALDLVLTRNKVDGILVCSMKRTLNTLLFRVMYGDVCHKDFANVFYAMYLRTRSTLMLVLNKKLKVLLYRQRRSI